MITIPITSITIFFQLIFLLKLGLICEATNHSYPGVPGERFLGPIVRVVGTVGQQQCVRECRNRPKLCSGVNYRKQHLLCELVSDTEKVEPNSDYVRFELEQKWTSQCASCSSDEKCVTLSSSQTYCVQDYLPGDCTALHDQESALLSGLYRVQLPVIGYVNVFCEMGLDSGGWTVFQRRLDGSVDFFRNWTDYKKGFGDLRSEFWLGNDILHYLLSQGRYKMRMDMADFDNQTRYVKYSYFNVGDEASKYYMTIFGHSGDVGDCFTTDRGINHMMFSTKYQDNDILDNRTCAVIYQSGWWYRKCQCANPNGKYLAGRNDEFGVGITYEAWRGQNYSLKFTQFMVKKRFTQFQTMSRK